MGMVAILLTLPGCSWWRGKISEGGRLEVVSQNVEPVSLKVDYESLIYTHDPGVETSFYLSDVPVKAILAGDVQRGQIVHVDLLWLPKPGKTPMDDTATNVSMRYIVIADGELGVYGGSGFAKVKGKIGNDKATIGLERVSLRLLESTAGFKDLLTPAEVTGSFTAKLDDRTARQLRYAASQIVTNKLGKSRLVEGGAVLGEWLVAAGTEAD